MNSKPINHKPNGCVTVPAPCVVWDGPELPGLNICKGDSITMPVYQLAKKLCTVQSYLSIGSYDLSNLDLEDCDVNSFVGMLQYLIEQIALLKTEINTGTVVANEINIDYTVPDCFKVNGVVQSLQDYVANIGNKVCSLQTELDNMVIVNVAQQEKLTDLEQQITALTS